MSRSSGRYKICSGSIRSELVEDAYRKVTWRIVPLLFTCYVFAYLDRVNIGFAKLQMQQELGLTEAVYGTAAGIFFIGYILFEVPSNLLLARIGARRTLSRILILWGITSGCMMFVRDASSFYLLRFALGVFEAGFAPGMLYYLTLWYAPNMLPRITALVLLAAPVASLIGGPVSGWLMSTLHGTNGLSGWQWMFMVEGLPTVVLGIVALMTLRDTPAEARWLTDLERSALQMNVGAHAQAKRESLAGALKEPKLFALALACFCIICGIYTVSFWLPSLLQGAGVSDLEQIGLYSAVPYVATVAVMIALAQRSAARPHREQHVGHLVLAGAVALAATALAAEILWLGLLSITLTACFLWCALSIFWTIPSQFLKGAAAAGGIALINSIGLLGGFASPILIGYWKTVTGSIEGGLWSMVAILTAGALLLLLRPFQETPPSALK